MTAYAKRPVDEYAIYYSTHAAFTITRILASTGLATAFRSNLIALSRS